MSQQAKQAPPKKSTEKLTLPPDNRHHWDEKTAKWSKRVRNTVFPLLYRTEVSGEENIPKDGSYIIAPTHQSKYDALAAMPLAGGRPTGSMAAIEGFTGVIGKLLAGSGTFPVDRYSEYEGDFPKPVDHAAEILDQGRPFIFYPEGRIYPDDQVYPLKTGIGRIAMKSKEAKYAIPVAKTFKKDTKSRPWEWVKGGLLAAAAGVGLYAATQASPGVAAGITGFLGGAALGGAAGAMIKPKDQNAAFLRTVSWAGMGALGGAALGTASALGFMPSQVTEAFTSLTGVSEVSNQALAIAAGTATGAAGLGATYHWTNRRVARIHVAKPIELQPYRDRAAASDDPDAVWKEGLKMTADHHKALVDAKLEICDTPQRFKMDQEGQEWGLQPDGSWVRVELNEEKQWAPIEKPGNSN